MTRFKTCGVELTELMLWSAFCEVARTRATIKPFWRRWLVNIIIYNLER